MIPLKSVALSAIYRNACFIDYRRSMIRLKPVALMAAAALSVLALTGCRSTPAPPPAAPSQSPAPDAFRAPAATETVYPITFTDMRGKSITLMRAPARIISVAPSNTELVFALGAGNRLVADTTVCDYPPEAKKLPHVDSGLRIDTEAIQVRKPDLVLAVNSINGKLVEALDRAGVPTLVVDPKTLDGAYQSIELVGHAIGCSRAASNMVFKLRASLNAIRRASATAATHPKVLLIYSVTPQIYTTGAGSFINELIEVAGGKNVVTAPSPVGDTLSSEKVIALQPDVLIAPKDLWPALRAVPGWAKSVPAVALNRLFAPSDPSLLERPAPRLADGVQELASYLHPEIFNAAGR